MHLSTGWTESTRRRGCHREGGEQKQTLQNPFWISRGGGEQKLYKIHSHSITSFWMVRCYVSAYDMHIMNSRTHSAHSPLYKLLSKTDMSIHVTNWDDQNTQTVKKWKQIHSDKTNTNTLYIKKQTSKKKTKKTRWLPAFQKSKM